MLHDAQNDGGQRSTPQPNLLARLVHGDGMGSLAVSLGGTDERFQLLIRGPIVHGPAARFFGWLVRLGLCLPRIGREVVFDLTGVTQMDLWGFGPLLQAALHRGVPFTVVLPRGLVPDLWLRGLTMLTRPRSTLDGAAGSLITLQFGLEHP